MTLHVIEVNTIERTERRYLVQVDTKTVAEDVGVPVNQVDEDMLKTYAEENVRAGEEIKFTEGNADIEEVIGVAIIDNSDPQ